jgi:hypothetical protein
VGKSNPCAGDIQMNLEVLVRIFTVFISSVSFVCFGQRGASVVKKQMRSSPLSSVPGFFDSYTLNKGGFTADILGAFDFGITDTLTVGTNTFAAITLLSSVPHVSLKVRGMALSSENFDSSFTAYGTFPVGNRSIRLNSYTATSMNSISFGSKQAVHLGFGYSNLQLDENQIQNIKFRGTSIQSAFVSAQYELFLSSWFDISFLAASSVLPRAKVETSSSIQRLQLNGLSNSVVLFRAMPTFFTDNWAFSIPFFSIVAPEGVGTNGLFFDIAYFTN